MMIATNIEEKELADGFHLSVTLCIETKSTRERNEEKKSLVDIIMGIY